MRTQNTNPAYLKFRNLLPSTGRYPARWVDIFSNTDEYLRYRDVEVVFIPRGEDAPDMPDAFWEEFAVYTRRWMADFGNSVAGWMAPEGFTPEYVFGMMLDRGFANQAELDVALNEFAHIEECDWARQLRDGQFLSEALINGAQDRDAVLSALRTLVIGEGLPWARSMLNVLEDEDN